MLLAYPDESGIPNAVVGDRFRRLLYAASRGDLLGSAGHVLLAESGTDEPRSSRAISLTRAKSTHRSIKCESLYAELLGPTLESAPTGVLKLNLDALHWGIRQLTVRLAGIDHTSTATTVVT